MESSKKKAALFGEWNTLNLGDKAIGEKATRYLLSLGYTVELFSLGNLKYLGAVTRPADVDRLFLKPEGASATYLPVSRKYKIIAQVKWFLSGSRLVWLRDLARFARNYLLIKRVARRLADCRYVVVGGGALLDGEDLHFPISLYFLTKAAKKLDKAIYSLGCSSSGNYNRFSRMFLKKFLAQAAYAATRDVGSGESLGRLTGASYDLFGDFALDLDEIDAARERAPAKLESIKIAFNIIFYFKDLDKQSRYEAFITELLNRLIDSGKYEITFFCTGDNGDCEYARQIHKKFPAARLFFPANLYELKLMYRDHDATIGSRLHSAIISLSSGVPVIGISIQEKVGSFFRSIGLGEHAFDISDFGNVDHILNLLDSGAYREQFRRINVCDLQKTRNKVGGFLR